MHYLPQNSLSLPKKDYTKNKYQLFSTIIVIIKKNDKKTKNQAYLTIFFNKKLFKKIKYI